MIIKAGRKVDCVSTIKFNCNTTIGRGNNCNASIEVFLNLFACIAVYYLVRHLKKRNLRFLFLSGVFASLGFLNKYQNGTCSLCGWPVDDFEQHVKEN